MSSDEAFCFMYNIKGLEHSSIALLILKQHIPCFGIFLPLWKNEFHQLYTPKPESKIRLRTLYECWSELKVQYVDSIVDVTVWIPL